MKMLGNALLSAAIIASPALAADVEKHSHVFFERNWNTSTLEAIQEKKNGIVPSVLKDAAPCLPADNAKPPLQKGADGVVMKEDEMIAKRYENVDLQLAEFHKHRQGSLKGKHDGVVLYAQSQIMELRRFGEDVYDHYEKKGGQEYQNLMDYVIGVSDPHLLALDSGLNDYVTGKPLIVGQIMLGGCMVTLPDEPDRAVGVEINGRINGAPMATIERLLTHDVATKFKDKFNTNKHFAYASDLDGKGRELGYIHLDTFHTSDKHTVNTFFHEIKHIRKEDRTLSVIYENTSAQERHEKSLRNESAASLYGVMKLSQSFFLDDQANSTGRFNTYIDSVIKSSLKMIAESSNDTKRLREALLENKVNRKFIRSLLNERIVNAFNNDEVCSNLPKEGRELQNAIDDCLFRIKNPYNHVISVAAFQDFVNEKKLDLSQLSNDEVLLMADNLTEINLSSHYTAKGLKIPHLQSLNKEAFKSDLNDVKERFHEIMDASPEQKKYVKSSVDDGLSM